MEVQLSHKSRSFFSSEAIEKWRRVCISFPGGMSLTWVRDAYEQREGDAVFCSVSMAECDRDFLRAVFISKDATFIFSDEYEVTKPMDEGP